MPELRQDPITDTWVIIATERSKRPSGFGDFSKEGKKEQDSCPFCVGNEQLTPPEIQALRKEGTEPDTPGWSIRVIPNKFAALINEGNFNRHKNGLYETMNGIGAHEVVVESPDHNRDLHQQPESHVYEILKIWRSRYRALGEDTKIKYTQLFKNYGSVAGASLAHPHSQIIATPLVPKNIAEEIRGLERHYGKNSRCIFCEMVSFEKEQKSRLVIENEAFISFCPYAARFPFETWIVPKHHSGQFAEVPDEELNALAGIMKQTINRLVKGVNEPPYNLVIHTSPYHMEDNKHYHWHIEILPRLTKVAGFEWGTGYYINPTPPEAAAEYLRQVQ